MNTYKFRVYLTSYVDVEVEAENLEAAKREARLNSDTWFAADNQILENVQFSDVEWIGTQEANDDEMQTLASFKEYFQK